MSIVALREWCVAHGFRPDRLIIVTNVSRFLTEIDPPRMTEDPRPANGKAAIIDGYAALATLGIRGGISAVLDITRAGYGLFLREENRGFTQDGPDSEVTDLLMGIGAVVLGPAKVHEAVTTAMGLFFDSRRA